MSAMLEEPMTPPGLFWVKAELEQSLTRARQQIELAVESADPKSALTQAMLELDQVRGTATLVQSHAVALLADEIRLTLAEVLGNQVKDCEAAYADVLAALVQLNDYVDAIVAGLTDCALVLQPALNELRVVRGRGLLTEAEIFADQIVNLDLGPSPPPSDIRKAGAASAVARRYLAAFRHALLGWLRGSDAEAALGRLGRIAEELAAATVNIHVYQFWRVQSAAVEALLTRSMDDRLEVKRLIGRAGWQIKLLAEDGEPAAGAAIGNQIAQMLFYLGRSAGQGPRVSALRKTYQLDERLPTAQAVEDLRSRIRGANTTLLEKLSDEIRRDLGEIKDAIDLAVRAGDKGAGVLTPTADKVNRVAATLSLLGLGALQRVMQNQAPRLLELQGKPAAAHDSQWLDLATAILRVEHSLDDALFRQLRGSTGTGSELEMRTPHGRDLREGIAAALRESLVNLSKLKTQTDAYLKSGDLQQVHEAAPLLGEVESSLRVMGQDRAAAQVAKLRRYAGTTAFATLRNDARSADRFADAIASVEMLLEAIQRGDPGTEARVEDLTGYVERIAFEAGATPVAAVSAPAPVAPAVPTLVVPAPALEPADPEIREIFLTEADEVRVQLEQQLPAFKRDPENLERLRDLRRAFHTLKGSGRMVGATHIGEFGWALENLLNRCLEGALAVTPEILSVVEDAVAMLPEMIHSYRDGLPAPSAMSGLIERARRYTQPAEALQVDHDVLNVFHEDARERLEALKTWLTVHPDADTTVDKDVVRALHTLRGSAALAHADSISQVSGAIENYLDALRGAELALPADGVRLLRDFAGQLPAWIAQADGRSPQPDAQPWLARVEALQASVPVSAVEAAEGRQLAEIFANEAFSDLEGIEHAARSWSQQPDAAFHARTLQALFQKLHGTAASSCPPVALVAQAFESRLTEFTTGKRVIADAGFFANLMQIIEGMYQQLDAFRLGTLEADGSELAARVFQLETRGGASPAAVAAKAEEIIEMPPVEDTRGDHDEVPTGVFQPASDPELVAIFITEAEELLVAFDRSLDLWERDPTADEPRQELARVLHTLKGSSRMAGLPGIGLVAQQLESYMPSPGTAADALLLGRLHRAADGLHQVLADVRVGEPPDTRALLAELSGESVTLEAPELEDEVIEMLPVEEVPAAPVAVAAAAELTAQADAELADIFAGEAAELIESLERNLQAWQSDPANEDLRREVQRALHTLKGGARMSGLDALGDASHEMETRIEAIERREVALDALAFGQLYEQLTQLHRLHDRMLHHEAAPLPERTGAEPTTELFEAPLPRAQTAPLSDSGWDPQLFWKPEDEQARLAALRRETARVPVEALDSLLNQAGEISIYRSRLEQHNSTLRLQLSDLQQTLTRLREQLRNVELETEAQIAARGLVRSEGQDRYAAEFDPLEMDRYSRMQELARALSESLNDIGVLHASLDENASEAETLLLQQGRLNTEVQTGLMSTLMVPFSRQVARLHRVVTQVADETGKQAEIRFAGVEAELDRKVLERMTAPLEHLLRNAVVHGIEDPADRTAAGKPAAGRITVTLRREGTQLAIEVEDDGRGLDYAAIRQKAIERGRMRPEDTLRDEEVALFIFDSGFSTAKALTQSAGRGVGMDVVAAEVKQLGGTLDLASQPGKGARFLIRLPLSLAAAQALLVGAGSELYAVPLVSIEGITRIDRERLADHERADGPRLAYGANEYRVRRLAEMIHAPAHEDAVPSKTLPVILVRLPEGLGGGERRLAVVVDHLYGNREVVSKAVGPQVSSVQGVTGATILPDGRVVLILDIPALVQERVRLSVAAPAGAALPPPAAVADTRTQIMVVDDSITIRRVTERLLDRAGFRVLLAKDGLDAIAQLQTEAPAAILLDIEMPRADGFEVATFVRNTARIARTPILMITSRSGDKHRNRAKEIGVDRYLTKPFQEEQLLAELHGVLEGNR